ncbi:hypothetical protein CANCADRAFT_13737, partial [Tortispora caseinolytica NRRL Y-17796]
RPMPISADLNYKTPLKRKPTNDIPVCDLQIRSYVLDYVAFFAEFAIRSAYFLGMPVSGPVPLPHKTERWTVIRGPFAHAKSKENFERITYRRLIQVKDATPKQVQTWLAFLRQHEYEAIGMKANVYQHASVNDILNPSAN